MQIVRIQVEEGFLHGLDLRFGPGLNVLIGPRGTGKTSIIELIRYCLRAPSLSDRVESSAREHARSILQGGVVTVTLASGGTEFTVSRTASDDSSASSGTAPRVTVLAQNEIESVGLDAVSRLRLIDAFRDDRDTIRDRASAIRAEARSLTVEARGIWQEMETLNEQRSALAEYARELATAEEAQRAQMGALADAEQKQAAINEISSQTTRLGVRAAVIDRANAGLSQWGERIAAAVSRRPVLEPWPDSAGPDDQLQGVRERVASALSLFEDAVERVTNARELLNSLRDSVASERVLADARARALRLELEEWQAGSGAIARRVADLREKCGQIEALDGLYKQLGERRATVVAQRDQLLDELDLVCQTEFQERQAVAASLNRQLHPRIHIAMERSGLPSSYVESLRDVLRGTGLRYNTLAPILAARLSPRELTNAVETGDARLIAEIVGIPMDRANRVLEGVAQRGAEDIVTCEIQDIVTLSLLDGAEYKSTENLSMGQRCTVVLPVLLCQRRDILVIDQPEDHLDNAFIVDTAVEAIRRRSSEGQVIVSTHNPNIPVLGEASSVTFLGSDGRRGFVRHSGQLDDPESVSAITNVMEGGLDAFRRRSVFYEDRS